MRKLFTFMVAAVFSFGMVGCAGKTPEPAKPAEPAKTEPAKTEPMKEEPKKEEVKK